MRFVILNKEPAGVSGVGIRTKPGGRAARRKIPDVNAVFTAAGKVQGNISSYLVTAIQELQKQFPLSEIAKLVSVADENAVYTATLGRNIDATISGLSEQISNGVALGAGTAAKELGRVAVIDLGRPRINKWVRERATNLIKWTAEDSRDKVIGIVRSGILGNRHASMIAKDLRGAVGLTDRLANAVDRKRVNLAARGLSPERVEVLTDSYRNRLIKYRANVIARTESITAVNTGRRELWEQLAEDGAIDKKKIVQAWFTVGDDRTCEICEPMDNQQQKIGDEFITGSGSSVLGPPAHQQCRCVVVIEELD